MVLAGQVCEHTLDSPCFCLTALDFSDQIIKGDAKRALTGPFKSILQRAPPLSHSSIPRHDRRTRSTVSRANCALSVERCRKSLQRTNCRAAAFPRRNSWRPCCCKRSHYKICEITSARMMERAMTHPS
ncbi:hypothetical protein PsYK624_153680 [Phanerochaete sordida]|uniref:Uncharacterized protein n=1 Tax=Phanerochaete sordida TaxID=48140 RepID=A0A9P3GP46_9APHY|nr:hypothetical protein PsYK624_153680 [Phanerochaete sordida]